MVQGFAWADRHKVTRRGGHEWDRSAESVDMAPDRAQRRTEAEAGGRRPHVAETIETRERLPGVSFAGPERFVVKDAAAGDDERETEVGRAVETRTPSRICVFMSQPFLPTAAAQSPGNVLGGL